MIINDDNDVDNDNDHDTKNTNSNNNNKSRTRNIIPKDNKYVIRQIIYIRILKIRIKKIAGRATSRSVSDLKYRPVLVHDDS